MKPFDEASGINPFLNSPKQSSWWLRDSTAEELETHRRLTKALTDLEHQWIKRNEQTA